MARQHFVAEIKPLTTKSGGALSLSGHPGGHPHPGRGIYLRRSLSGRYGLLKVRRRLALGLHHRRPVENPLVKRGCALRHVTLPVMRRIPVRNGTLPDGRRGCRSRVVALHYRH